MPNVEDVVLDAPLEFLEANFERLYLCSAEPTTFLEATATFAIGYKEAPAISSPANRTPTGRQITVGPITGGVVVNSGTVLYWAAVDMTNSRILAHRTVGAPTGLTFGSEFEIAAFTIGIPDSQ